MTKLRQSAKDAPHCFSCFKENMNRELLCLAHSNELRHGRGAYHKTPDIFGAIVCFDCHELIDGRKGGLSKEDKHDMHRMAHDFTLAWWMRAGVLKVT